MAGSSASTEESARSKGISLVDEANDFLAQDHESETGSSPLASSTTMKTIPQQSKRWRPSLATLPLAELTEPESLSTISHTTSVEEAALNLMLLSRDSWTRAEQQSTAAMRQERPTGKSRLLAAAGDRVQSS
ncbi:hypothetical protein AXF42_Ash014786 [Apostasia shenzhenica]|uniref:Uncharacterized protein n=1 Tax=Apostasia shenzhenica TaxID=1088818 RepID=A0A2H9ZWA8_9ASPA|nr:hypothetical protein AXF42_Ash014786 [Apostasia shenzhenica]